MSTLKVGDRVRWHSHGSEAQGKIVRAPDEEGRIGDFDDRGSRDDPRYIVKTEDGKHAAHKAGSLERAQGSAQISTAAPLRAAHPR